MICIIDESLSASPLNTQFADSEYCYVEHFVTSYSRAQRDLKVLQSSFMIHREKKAAMMARDSLASR